MKNLNKVAKVCAKIIEVFYWVCVGVLVIGLILTIVTPGTFENILEFAKNSGGSFSELNSNVLTADGFINFARVRFMLVAGIFPLGLMAMIARNINLIFNTMDGKNKNMKSTSPFQADVVRLVREIGIFFLAIPVLSALFTFLSTVFLNFQLTESAIDLGGIATGIIILCLSQVFAYGAELEEEVDGLV